MQLARSRRIRFPASGRDRADMQDLGKTAGPQAKVGQLLESSLNLAVGRARPCLGLGALGAEAVQAAPLSPETRPSDSNAASHEGVFFWPLQNWGATKGHGPGHAVFRKG